MGQRTPRQTPLLGQSAVATRIFAVAERPRLRVLQANLDPKPRYNGTKHAPSYDLCDRVVLAYHTTGENGQKREHST